MHSLYPTVRWTVSPFCAVRWTVSPFCAVQDTLMYFILRHNEANQDFAVTSLILFALLAETLAMLFYLSHLLWF